MFKTTVKDLGDLDNVAWAIIDSFNKNEIIAVSGPLGVGKTALAKKITHNLGIKENITSPSFNILKIYSDLKHERIKKFIHIDAYRLKSSQELINIGMEDYLNFDNTLIYIEWAEKVLNILPPDRLINLKINFLVDKEAREITLFSPLKNRLVK